MENLDFRVNLPDGFAHDAPEGDTKVSNGQMVEEKVDASLPLTFRLVEAVHDDEIPDEGEDGHHAENKALGNGVMVEGWGVENAANVETVLLNDRRVVHAQQLLADLGRVHKLKRPNSEVTWINS